VSHVVHLPARGHPVRVAWQAAVLTCALSAGVLVESAARQPDAAGDLAVYVAFVVCGLLVWSRGAPDDLTAPLMLVTGIAWLLGGLVSGAALLHRGPLVQLLVAWPGGRPRSRAQWLVVAAGYLDALIPALGRDEHATVALASAVSILAVVRYARADGVERRARAVPAVAAPAIAAVLVAGALAPAADGDAVLVAYEIVLVTTAVALSGDLRWGGWTGAAVTGLVIDLGKVSQRGSLTAALARAVGDPSLVVAYRLDDGRHVDERGRPVALPDAAEARAVTAVEVDGVTEAVLVHDPVALRAPGLSDAVVAAMRIALHNVRLQADVAARVQDVAASRSRLLRTRDGERRRLASRLDAGVGARLDAAALAIAGLGSAELSTLGGDLDRAREDVRRFAAGLRPPGLEEGGLAAALRVLAADAPLETNVSVECDRVGDDAEETAWYVCSEALANAVKHAGATRVAVAVALAEGWLVVTVEDDGRGGADPGAGTGLRGLAARVEAAGGQLEVGDRPRAGTRLCARLPAGERS
jgi:signal transduction histidine kinase